MRPQPRHAHEYEVYGDNQIQDSRDDEDQYTREQGDDWLQHQCIESEGHRLGSMSVRQVTEL